MPESKDYTWKILKGVHTLEVGPVLLPVTIQISEEQVDDKTNYRFKINGEISKNLFPNLKQAQLFAVNQLLQQVSRLDNILEDVVYSLKE